MRHVVARDIMNKDVLQARDTMTVGELAAFLTDNEISGAPVTDETGRLVGVVSLSDVARVAVQVGGVAPDRSGPDFYLWGWEDAYNPEDLQRLRIKGEGMQVAEFMTRSVHSVGEEATLPEMASAMVKGHVHRLMVTQSGKVVGIVSTMDLLRVMAQAD